MFETSAHAQRPPREWVQRRHVWVARERRAGSVSRLAGQVARERRAGYASRPAGPVVPARPTAGEALAQLDAALAVLGDVDWAGEPDCEVNAAAVGLQRAVNRVSAQALAPLTVLQRRESYRADGAVTAPSWLRNRANLDPAVAARVCTAARRLPQLKVLAAAFGAGDVTLAHVTAITEAAVPGRFNAIRRVEDTLVELARTAKPQAVRTALRAIRDVADPDGSDITGDEPPVDADPDDARRYWRQHPTVDGMVLGEYLVDAVFAEMLATLFDAYSTPDPAELPALSRRTAAHKRADAMRAAVTAILNAGIAPTVQGVKPHLLGMVDLLAVMNRDQAAVVAGEIRRTGRVSAATIARIGLDAKITPVLTMGPWRVVAVGRTFRTLPPWLRPMLEMLHRRCRGPDCDRPAVWAEAHHEHDFADGADTDLNTTIPLCGAHHDLVTYGGWHVTLNLNTGVCTWTAPDGRTIHVPPHR